jgi:arylsulfatase A-like enzyme/cytochrome c-type biogenesis protein CcmH/NrfG
VAALAAAGGIVLLPFSGKRGLRRPPEPPNVLLISVDTLRADHLGAYGARLPTPAFDDLARQGALFEKAVSHVPITLPSHASLLTGALPVAHGVRDNGSFRLDGAQKTLAESFKAGGYRTAAFIGSFALDSRFGLDQGFELYDDFYGDTSDFNDFAISERPAETVLRPALDWIQGLGSERWFAFVHLYDPHVPYAPPPPFRERHGSDLYTGEVAYVDEALGGFLRQLRQGGHLSDTLVVVTADHGEGLGEHGEKTHGMFAYESTLHVPLTLTWPGVIPEGLRVRTQARLMDVAPTLVGLAGLSPEPGHQGRSLVPLLEKPDRGEDEDSYFEALAFNLNRNWAPLTGLYRGRYKFIDLPIPELYDLRDDPKETHNLAETSAGMVRQMQEALGRHVEAHSTAESREIRTAPVDAETEARLRALGYVVGATAAKTKPSQYTPDDDPKRLVELSDRLDEGIALHLAGRSDEAERVFGEILERRPDFTNVYVNLAYVLRESGRLGEAIATLEKAMQAGLTTRTMLGRLGLYLQEDGRLKESAALLQYAIEQDPTHAEAYNYLAVSYARLGRHQAAVETLEKLLKLDPSYASAYNNLGSVYLEARDYPRAEQSFKRALQLDERLAAAWNGLGVVSARMGRHGEAIAAWKRAVAIDPRQFDTLYNLGTLLTRLNRFAEAIPYLEQFVRTAPPDRYGSDLPKVQRLVAELRARV